MQDAEEWLLILNECRDNLQRAREGVSNRNQKTQSDEVFKINATLRTNFKTFDRDIQDLKEALPGLSYELYVYFDTFNN